MGQTLTHGVYLPDEGERNCYSGLAANWQILDTSVGTIAAHTAALAGKAPAVHTHTKSDITDFPAYGNTAGTICEGNDSRLSDARTPVAHTHGKADITDLFNSANTWTALNSYNQSIQITANFNIGVAPSSDVYGGFNFSNGNTNIGNVTARVNNAGATYTRLYIGNKFTNGALDQNGTWKYAELQVGLRANGDRFIYTDGLWRNSLTPYDSAVSIGDSNHQWNNLYAKNYYYNGTAWGLDKANVWSAIQTISYAGSNVAIALKNQETDIAASPTRNNWHYINFYDKNSVALGGFNYSKRTNGNSRVYLNLRTKNTNNDIVEKNVFFETNQEGTDWNLYPASNADINLGTSTNQWKTLNGINPGALSLPDYNNYLDVTSSIPVAGLDGNTQININDYLPNKTGWLSIVIDDTAGNSIIATQGKSGGSTAYNNSRTYHTGAQSNGFISVFFPIIAGLSKTVLIKASSLIQMRFYYCLGNV